VLTPPKGNTQKKREQEPQKNEKMPVNEISKKKSDLANIGMKTNAGQGSALDVKTKSVHFDKKEIRVFSAAQPRR
jgi:hypothetical protein